VNSRQATIRKRITQATPRLCAGWVWDSTVGAMTLMLACAVAVIIALALGWNNPRPNRPPAWEDPGPPLHLVATAEQAAVTLLGTPVSDFTFEVEALPLSDSDLNNYGLVYRAQDAAHYTTFAVGSDGYYAVLRVAGDEEVPLIEWQQFPHVKRGQQSNRLRVACAGPKCRFYVNDEYAATVEDDTWLEGDLGVWAQAYGCEDAIVQFEHIRIWEDQTPIVRRDRLLESVKGVHHGQEHSGTRRLAQAVRWRDCSESAGALAMDGRDI